MYNIRKINYKIYLIFLYIIFYSFFLISYTEAAQQTLISTKVRSIFVWGIGISAILAGISFAWGAIQYMFSLDNPSVKKDATSRMISSLLGLILCFSSILIINTINPQITKLEFGDSIGEQASGIYFSNGNQNDDINGSFSIPDPSIILGLGYTKIKYVCKNEDGALINNNIPLLVWFYPQKNFKDSDPKYKNTKIINLDCNNIIEIQGKSFKMSSETDGIYLFLDSNCNGFRSEPFLENLNPIDEPFINNVKSIKIVNKKLQNNQNTLKSFYGIIFHDSKKIKESGLCSEPIVSDGCHDIGGVSTISAHIFNIFKYPYTVDESASKENEGVYLYSKPWGWQTGSYAGYNSQLTTDSENSQRLWEKSIRPNQVNFSYKNCSPGNNDCETLEYRRLCRNFSDCPGSIQRVGNYLIVLSTNPNYGDSSDLNAVSSCQVFNKNIHSIKELEFFGEGNNINSIKLIPTL